MKGLAALVLVVVAVSLSSVGVSSAEEKKSVSRYARELESLLKDNRVEAVANLIKEMGTAEDPKVAVLIPQAGIAFPSAANYDAAVAAIVELKSEASIQGLVAALKNPKTDFRQKVLILEACGRRDDRPTLNAVIEQLRNKVVHAVVGAIHAARARKERELLAPLMDLLSTHWKSRDRVCFEAHEALIDLTGKDFESLEDWKKFLDALPEAFDPKQVGKETGPTRIATKKANDVNSVRFFGSEIFSRNLIFVIDVSGSMFMYDESKDYKGSNVEQDRQRLRRAKEQLTQAVKKLPPTALFNIITFSSRVLTWQKQLERATPANIASALKFVKDFKAEGATHTDEALEMAFKDLAIDTIVLLSDGAPMHRRDDDPKALTAKILRRVKDINASRKVTIHTFGFDSPGKWPEKVPWAGGAALPAPPGPEELKVFVDFLTTLARDNGGAFEPIQ